MDLYPRTWAEVDLGALTANLRLIRRMVEPSETALVSKADGYGHGLVPVSRAAAREGIKWFAVATVSEAVALRDAGIEGRIIILSPILPIEAEQAVFYGLDITIENEDIASALSAASVKQGRETAFHLKVDTGLARFGCSPAEAADLAVRCLKPGLRLAGVSTHFVDSRTNLDRTDEQIKLFLGVKEEFARRAIQVEVWHASNSFGAESHGEARLDLVRVGMHAYGIDGRPDSPFRPVMSLKSRVVAAREVEKGATVGYNGGWTAPEKSRILTIGAGYGDGYPRHLSSKGSVLVGQTLCPVVGLICMDLLMVDATQAPGAQVGDVVTLLGGPITAADLARAAGTNAHEIVTRIAPRVPRRIITASPS